MRPSSPSGRPSSSCSFFQVAPPSCVTWRLEPGPARLEGPRPAPELPHRREQLARVLRVEDEIAAARLLVDVEDLLPVLAAVFGLEDAAIGVFSPLLARRAHPRGVGIRRMERDPVDALGLLEAEVGPGLAAVERAVDAVAHRHAVPGVALSGAHPDDVRVRLIDGQQRRSHAPAGRRTSARSVRAPFVDFHTPPVAAPAQTTSGFEAEASIAAIRPLMPAGPIERAFRPASVSGSTPARAGNARLSVSKTRAARGCGGGVHPIDPPGFRKRRVYN